MSGDCDGFAVMMAYFTQAYFGFDPRAYILDVIGDAVGHAVAGDRTSMDVIYWYYGTCLHSAGPYVTAGETAYLLIDMTRFVAFGPNAVQLVWSGERSCSLDSRCPTSMTTAQAQLLFRHCDSHL